MPWHMTIDQVNAAAKSNGQFFNKTNGFAQNESANRFESRIGMFRWNANVTKIVRSH